MTAGDDEKALMHRAGRLLARRPYARGELRRRLLRYADPECADRVVDRLADLNLLNDAEYAYNFALSRIKQESWGPLKVRSSLARRDVDPKTAEAALTRIGLEVDEESIVEQLAERLCRHSGYPRHRNGVRKLINALRRRGFHDEPIMTVLRRRLPAAAWRQVETGD